MNKRVALLGLIMVSVSPVRPAHARQAPDAGEPTASDPGTLVYHWGLDLPDFPGAETEITRFGDEDGNLPPERAREYSRSIRIALFSAARDAISRIGQRGCEPSIRVSFPDTEEWGFEDLGSTDRKFFESLIRTEAVACYSFSAQPGSALDLYTSSGFRMDAESRIERMWQEGGLTCVATAGVPLLLSPTEVCNRVDRFVEASFASEHSQVTRNGSGDWLQKVFFKESLKTFVSTPGGLAFHYINYTRSVDLGRASRWIAPGKIEESQRSQMELLRARLGG